MPSHRESSGFILPLFLGCYLTVHALSYIVVNMNRKGMVIVAFDELDLVQVASANFKLIDRDSGCALETFVNVTDVDALTAKVRAQLHE